MEGRRRRVAHVVGFRGSLVVEAAPTALERLDSGERSGNVPCAHSRKRHETGTRVGASRTERRRRKEATMGLQIGEAATGLRGRQHRGPDARSTIWIGDSWARVVLASEGLHAGVHDRARLHGPAPAGVRAPRGVKIIGLVSRRGRPTMRRGTRTSRRPRVPGPEGTRSSATRLQRVEALRDAAPRTRPAIPRAGPRPTTRPCGTCS